MVENAFTEPLFGNRNCDLALDFLEDQLNYLGDENELHKKSPRDPAERIASGTFGNGVYAVAIFKLCQNLNQPAQVKYHAIELFQLFMSKHLPDVLKQTKKCFGNELTTRWPIVLKRVKSQIFLRMLSCIQIASKIRTYDNRVRLGAILYTIRKAKQTFNKTCVEASEVRVLQTVDYKTNQKTALDYMEIILEVLVRNQPSVNVELLYSLCLRIVDAVYIEKKTVYEELYKRVTGRKEITSTDEKQHWQLIERDVIFLIVAVISCAAYIIDSTGYVKVVKALKNIVNIPVDEILDFTVVLCDFIMKQ